MPYFSLITAAYNRESSIRRAIESCLSQDFPDFELIVVDDCSTDKTAEVVKSFVDPRVILVRRSENGGPCQARNSAVDRAGGLWCVIFDSDFSLKPSALRRLREWSENAAPRTGNIISACEWDNGWRTPQPMPPPRMDYEGYLKWWEQVEISEYFNCIRREVFQDVRYASSRAWETSFHLGLAKRWQLAYHDECLLFIHTDATNRLTTARGRSVYQRLLADAPDKVANFRAIFFEHGQALSTLAPRTLVRLQHEALKQACLAGLRFQAWRWFFASRALFNARCHTFLLLGLFSPRVLAAAYAYR